MRDIRQEARTRLGAHAEALDALTGPNVVDLDWYLKDKIVRPSDQEQFLDHVRVLKYACLFVLCDAQVTFLREMQSPTPDLRIDVDGFTFYVEVKKFRMTEAPNATPSMKIVSAVHAKLPQLLPGSMNLIAIDNFDIHLEPKLSHDHIRKAIEILGLRSADQPELYKNLSGLVLAASTGGGLFSTPEEISFPHFFWVNPSSANTLPPQLAQWIANALGNPVKLSGRYSAQEPSQMTPD